MDKRFKDAGSRALALASLHICESLLLELLSKKVLDSKDIQGLLKDAAKALAASEGADADFMVASELVEAMRERYERLPDPKPVF